MPLIIELSFFILLIIIFGTMLWAGFSAAPWLPSRKRDLKLILELAEIKPGETVFDLGSGDGRWLVAVARETKAAKIVGFEISLLLYLWSRIKILFSNYPQIEIKYKNFYNVDFSRANVIMCFLTPRAMRKLEDKLDKEMSAGSRFISYCFKLPGLKPEKVARFSQKSILIYLYKY